MKKMSQLFHMVEFSPWPFLTGFGSFSIFSSLVIWFSKSSFLQLFISFFIVSFISVLWWRDVIRESLMQGFHTFDVQLGLKVGMLLFIFSEVMFFSGFFWAFLHASLSPTMELGLIWPPISVNPLNPFRVPFLNTLVLVSSGVTVTWSHHSLMMGESGSISLGFTVGLGIYFTLLQYMEYNEAMFSIADCVYGSVFFIGTGFHGFHVLVGSIFLFICFSRMVTFQFSPNHLVGFEMAIWYWHFVDVVWLFLFSLIYWWGF